MGYLDKLFILICIILKTILGYHTLEVMVAASIKKRTFESYLTIAQG
jgi:hypothetical protein